MPLVLLLFLLGVVGVLLSLYKALFQKSINGFYWGGAGTFLVVFALFLIAGLNNTCFYPSIYDLQGSLHIENSSSSHYTLTAMVWVAFYPPWLSPISTWHGTPSIIRRSMKKRWRMKHMYIKTNS